MLACELEDRFRTVHFATKGRKAAQRKVRKLLLDHLGDLLPRSFALLGFGMGVMNSALRRRSIIRCVG